MKRCRALGLSGSLLLFAACSNATVASVDSSVPTTVSPTTTTTNTTVPTSTTSSPEDLTTTSLAVAESGPSARFVEFREQIDARIAGGQLNLGAIDRFWTEGQGLLGYPTDVTLIEVAMSELAAARTAQLADLPPVLEEHRDVLTAALVDRDTDLRIVASRALATLSDQDSLSDTDRNLVQSILDALSDVRPVILRADILASGRIGPALDPERLPDLPDSLLLVHWTDGFEWPDLVVLVGLDGIPLGYLDDHSIWGMELEGGKVVSEAPIGPPPDDMEGCMVAWSDEDREYLICEDSTSYDTVALRAEIRIRYPDGTEERLAGAAHTRPDSPRDPVAGLWVWLTPSPAGDALLGGWSGECSIGSAHMVVDGETLPAGGGDAPFHESYPLGWLDNDHALIVMTASACSIPMDAAGVYTMTVDGDIEPLYLTSTGGAIARLIKTTAL